MGVLTKAEYRFAKQVCDEEQRERFDRSGQGWTGRMCEVEAAKRLNDDEFLMQPWCVGGCSPLLILDHIDNNPMNNPVDGSNHQWLCRSHNVRKNPPHGRTLRSKFLSDNNSEHYSEKERERKRERERKNEKEGKIARKIAEIRSRAALYSEGGDDLRVNTVEMVKNMMLRDKFEVVVKRIMRKAKEASWSELVDAAVQETKCTLENGTNLRICISTGEKWLRPLCARLSPTAPFVVERRGGDKIVQWKEKKSNGSAIKQPAGGK